MTDADFDPQRPSYWQRVDANLAGVLGVQHVSALDLVILLPLFPLLVIGVIWLAPWEGWVWANVPKTTLGPYLLYCAFVFWHFRANFELVSIFLIVGLAVCALALKQIYDKRNAARKPEP